MSWFKPLRDIIKEIDKAVDRGAELFREHVEPVIRGAARDLDEVLDSGGKDFEKNVRSKALVLDERYQRFMVQRVDPLFGQTRNEHLGEMGSLEISQAEVVLNRRFAYSAATFLAILVGKAVAPATLFISLPIAFAMMVPVYEKAYESVKQQRRVTYHVVSALGVTGVWLLGLYVPAIGSTMFYYMGEKLLLVTEDRSHKGIISVFSKQPRTVWLVRDGVETERPFEEVLRGDIIVVSAGGFMPVDGTVTEGLASIDQQMLTGEAQPVEKGPGDTVYAATVVLAGKVYVRVDKAGSQTVAAKIGEVLNNTASYQLALQSKGSKIAHDAALPTLLIGAAAFATLGPESGLAALNSSFGVTVRMSGPITMLNLLNIASYNAILLKDGRSLDLLSDVDTVLFDKTGTLTLSQPKVAAVHSTGAFKEDRLLMFAAAAERRQTHPIALAIVAEAEARVLDLPDIENARYEVGYGIKVQLKNQTILVGSDRFMGMSEVHIPEAVRAQQAAGHALGHSFVMVAVNGKLAGMIELAPTVRPEAEAVIKALHDRGLKIMIVSGDQEEPTRQLAKKLGLDRYFAGVLPEGKADLVAKLQAEGRSVCFVGDGINDSIALKKANVSVSLRGATTAATDAAQVVLMQESLQQIPYLFKLADQMASSLKAGYWAGMIPGVINVAGVFLLGWGYYASLALNVVSLGVSLGVAMYPMYVYKKELKKTGALPSKAAAVDVDVPQLLPAAAPKLPAAAKMKVEVKPAPGLGVEVEPVTELLVEPEPAPVRKVEAKPAPALDVEVEPAPDLVRDVIPKPA